MYSKIKIPQTNRLVNITSKSGKLIIKKYLQKLYGGSDAHAQTNKDSEDIIFSKKDTNYICKYYSNLSNSDLSNSDFKEIIEKLEVKVNKIMKNTLKTTWNNEVYMTTKSESMKMTQSGFPWRNKSAGELNLITLENKDKNNKKNLFLVEKSKESRQLFKTDQWEYYQTLDELLITKDPYKTALNECPNIVPFKIINNKFYMIKAHGTLADLIDRKQFISINFADQIINSLVETLACLYKKGVYYFDIKAENVLYMCTKDGMVIWLINLGRIIPKNVTFRDGVGGPGDRLKAYLSSYPHPAYNLKLYDRTVMSNDTRWITPNLIPFTLDIYSYQLSLLFYDLIDYDEANAVKNASYKYMTKTKLIDIITNLREKKDNLNIKKNNYIIKKYYKIYEKSVDPVISENYGFDTNGDWSSDAKAEWQKKLADPPSEVPELFKGHFKSRQEGS